MKKLLIVALSLITIVSCKKKEEDKVTPTNSVVKVETLSVVRGSDDSLRTTITYNDKNSATYINDLLYVYYADTMSCGISLGVFPANATKVVVALHKYKGGGYKVRLIRQSTSSTSSAIDSASGN